MNREKQRRKIVAKINEWPLENYSFLLIESCAPGPSFHFPISGLDWESRISLLEFFSSNSAISNGNSVSLFVELIYLIYRPVIISGVTFSLD
jgi:hypothetical protein